MTTPAQWQPRLIAIDIDGTLALEGTDIRSVGPEGITTPVRAALADAVAAGALVVLCSGRTVMGVRPFLASLHLSTGWAICSNGAVLLDAATGEVARTVDFDPAEPARVLRKLIPDAVFVAEQVGVGNRCTVGIDLGSFFGDTTVVDFDTLISFGTPRMSVLWPGHDYADMAELVAGVEIPGVHYSLDHHDACLMATPPGVTKGSALETLRIELGVAAEDTMAIGDGFNDVEMLAWAAHGVAMGQAPEPVRAVADEVTASVSEDGLALALRRWFPES
ncbi:MAG TPA: HAD hydrolase family protein [Pseudonocardiaceae bacterium]|nr:HAD hydrolase family protein [Pseudonocardiaceae bacterium]